MAVVVVWIYVRMLEHYHEVIKAGKVYLLKRLVSHKLREQFLSSLVVENNIDNEINTNVRDMDC